MENFHNKCEIFSYARKRFSLHFAMLVVQCLKSKIGLEDDRSGFMGFMKSIHDAGE